MKKNQIFRIIMIVCLALGIMLTACACNSTPKATDPTEKPTEAPTDAPTDKPTDKPDDTDLGYKVTVVDIAGDPLKGATVQLCIGELCQLPVATDENGVAIIDAAEDNYTVKVTLAGYVGEPYYSFPEGSKELTVTLNVTHGTDASNPIWFTISDEGAVSPITIGAGKTVYYTHRVGGTTMTVTNAADVTVTLGETEYTHEFNTITIEIPDTYSSTNPPVFAIKNSGTADVTCAVAFVYPTGSMNNPATAVVGENTAAVEADSQGYFYTYVAEADGTVTVTIDEACTNWTCTVSNVTANIYGQNNSSNDTEPNRTQTVEVSAGDRVQIVIGTADHAEGNVSFDVSVG